MLLGYSFNRFDKDLERRFCPIFNEIGIWKDTFYVLAESAFVEPAHEVGGDFFDYYQLPDGRFVDMVADVSDKGIPAAIFMMKSRLILRAQVARVEPGV